MVNIQKNYILHITYYIKPDMLMRNEECLVCNVF